MTAARAPGKVVLSGAYAVLHGAPAIVTAIACYVEADSARAAELVTPEVEAALEPGEAAPWFDASALREGGRKLGLGSSAAILVASLYALELQQRPQASEAERRERVFQRALAAHRAAQGGGSGVDVAASSFGGTLSYRVTSDGSRLSPLTLPPKLVLEVWCCPASASTRELLAAVARLERSAPAEHQRLLAAQAQAAEQAVESLVRGDLPAFISSLTVQQQTLLELGHQAGVGIVTPELAQLAPLAEEQQGVLLPAGAGGGDIAIFAGQAASSAGLREALLGSAHGRLQAALAAPGAASA